MADTCATQPVVVLRGENGEKVLVDILGINMDDGQRDAVNKLFHSGGDISTLRDEETSRIKDLKYRVGFGGGELFAICRFDLKVVRIDEK